VQVDVGGGRREEGGIRRQEGREEGGRREAWGWRRSRGEGGEDRGGSTR
jgi:hypothetical protein